MTFNVQHGLNGAGTYDLSAAARTIAKVNPDLVGVQELTRNHPTYNCDDQPARIADAVSAATGRHWTAMYQQEWFTPDRSCQNSGRGDGPETEGIAFFAPEPLGGPTTTALWNGRLGLLARLVRGRDVPIVVTHLASGQDGQSDRMRQLDGLLPWATGNAARMLICDCNMWPDSPEYQKARAQFHDAWQDAVANGTARGRADGITHKTVRIDYIFYNPDALQLLWAEDIDTKPLIGSDASDHNPVQASFKAK
jgi:endonuclease/exonuclease/phosphatase family metal-dependent hydrolase